GLGVLLGSAIAGWLWLLLSGSLPTTEGVLLVPGLTAPVRVERDVLGIPTLVGESRVDLAFATGFVHGQDRFFQMDLLRRRPAGELAELAGPGVVPLDVKMRVHRFRARARRRVEATPPEERALLTAYTQGVRAGLASLSRQPWEYFLLGVAPAP